MMKKTLAVLALALVLALGLTGCIGNFYESAGTINGTDISGGLYLMAQYNAYTEARTNEQIDAEKDLLKQKIDGVSTSEWIKTRTEELLRRYVAIRALCRERDIELDSTGQQNIQQMQQYWTYLEDTYANNGISYETFTRYLTVDELSRQLFNDLYAEDGELAVPDEELKKQYGEEYAHIRAYSIPLNSLTEGVDVAADVLALAEKLPAKLEGGMTLEEVVTTELGPIYELTGREFTADTAADSIYSNYIQYAPDNYDTYSEEFLAKLKDQKVGDYGIYNMGSTVILYEKVDTFEDDEAYQTERENVLSKLKSDEYQDYLAAIYDTYDVEWLPFVRNYYRPSKIKSV